MRFRVKDLGIDVHSEDIVERAPICPATGISQCGRGSIVGQSICTDCTTQAFSICGGTRCGACSVNAVSVVCSDCTTQQFSICGGTRCGPCSVNAVSVVCSDCTTQQFSICGGTPCPAISADPCSSVSLRPDERLARLKAQLQEALSEIEKQEADMAEALAPQTVEEVDLLESKLHEALEALQERRAEIQSRTENEG